MGNHPDVVVDGSGRAWLFYFTQQSGEDAKPDDPNWKRRSFLHVTELHEKDGILTVDRNAPATSICSRHRRTKRAMQRVRGSSLANARLARTGLAELIFLA